MYNYDKHETYSMKGKVMGKRKEMIQRWISLRLNKNEIQKCIFCITPSRYSDNMDFDENKVVRKINDILTKNHVEYRKVDTVEAAWNLDREWIETNPMDCVVEYCGVYPVDWNIDDTVELERMEKEGEILIHVNLVVDGMYAPNH